MKRRLATTTVIFLLVAAVLSLGGCIDDVTPLGGTDVAEGATAKTYTVYVSGAVQREGYFEVTAGASYDDIFVQAGLLPQSILPALSNLVDGTVSQMIVDYFDGEKTCSAVNVNGVLVALRQPIEGIPQEVTNKLADYLDEFGAIRNRIQLQAALGELYQQHFFKFFVAMEDYEEVG